MSETAPPAGQAVFRLIYRSRNLIPEAQRRAEFGTLFSTARSNNKKSDITGALLLSGDWFVQVLEGDEQLVRDLFDRIAADGRHEDVSILATGLVAERVFARWAMAKVADEGEPDIPLIAHKDGISPAAARTTTPAQDAVLDEMRKAAHAAL